MQLWTRWTRALVNERTKVGEGFITSVWGRVPRRVDAHNRGKGGDAVLVHGRSGTRRGSGAIDREDFGAVLGGDLVPHRLEFAAVRARLGVEQNDGAVFDGRRGVRVEPFAIVELVNEEGGYANETD